MIQENTAILYEDDDLLISKTSVIYKGKRIPISSIKKIRRELQTLEGTSWSILNPSYTALVLDLGMLRKSICVFREVIGSDPCEACFWLPRGHAFSSLWSKEQKDFLQSLSYDRTERIETMKDLRNVPGIEHWVVEIVGKTICYFDTCNKIESAIKSAMASLE